MDEYVISLRLLLKDEKIRSNLDIAYLACKFPTICDEHIRLCPRTGKITEESDFETQNKTSVFVIKFDDKDEENLIKIWEEFDQHEPNTVKRPCFNIKKKEGLNLKLNQKVYFDALIVKKIGNDNPVEVYRLF